MRVEKSKERDPRGPTIHVIVMFGATGGLARRSCSRAVPKHESRLLRASTASRVCVTRPHALTRMAVPRTRPKRIARIRRHQAGRFSLARRFAERLSFGPPNRGTPRTRSGDRAGGEEGDTAGPPADCSTGVHARRVTPRYSGRSALRPGHQRTPGDPQEAVRPRPGLGARLVNQSGARACADDVARSSASTTSGARNVGTSSRSVRDERLFERLKPMRTSATCRSTCRQTLSIKGRAAYDATGPYRRNDRHPPVPGARVPWRMEPPVSCRQELRTRSEGVRALAATIIPERGPRQLPGGGGIPLRAWRRAGSEHRDHGGRAASRGGELAFGRECRSCAGKSMPRARW